MIACVVVPGFELRAALAPCPGLVLVERDPAAVEEESEALLRRLEDAGFAVEPLEPGVVVFETAGGGGCWGGGGGSGRFASRSPSRCCRSSGSATPSWRVSASGGWASSPSCRVA